MVRDDKSTKSGATGSGAAVSGSTSSGSNGFGPEDFSVFIPPRARRPGFGTRHVLFAGVASACVLGAGLGLWARPGMNERQAAAAPADRPAAMPVPANRKLQIVVNEHPAPIGAPIDVLPASGVHPTVAPIAPAAAPEPLAPRLPPQGLLRVQDVSPLPAARLQPAPSLKPAAKPKPAARPKPTAVAALPAPKPAAAKARPPVAPPVHLAKAAPPSKPSHATELARASAAKAAAHRTEVAKAAQAARDARDARTAKADRLLLAKAQARAESEARAQAKAEALADARDDARKRARLAAIAHALQHLLPHEARPREARPAPVELAKLDRKHARKAHHEPRVEQASLKARKPSHPVEPPAHSHAAPVAPPPRVSGLMKVSAPRCASRDPGEALVCADPSLGAADRQLSRAYQGARAAGVPDAQLQRQQQRWLAARSAAAREAPWVVHDVYLARIAELNGLAKEAHGDGY